MGDRRHDHDRDLAALAPDEVAALADLMRAGGVAAADETARDLLRSAGGLGPLLGGERRPAPAGRPTALLTACRDLLGLALRRRIDDRPLLADRRAVLDHLHYSLAHQRREVVMLLLLDTQLRLIADEVVATGTTDRVALDVRRCLRSAIDRDAASMILVHNHPGGTLTPSPDDRTATRLLAAGGKAVGVELLDHIVIARSGYASFKDMGLL